MTAAPIITAKQIKAARALLDWSQDDLALASELSVATIRKIEAGNISPRGSTNNQIRKAIETGGLEFLDGEGVKRRREDLVIYEGQRGVKDFFDDVYRVASQGGQEILIVCPNADTFFTQTLGEYKTIHVNRMAEIRDIVTVRCILTQECKDLPGAAYAEYRYLSQNFLDSVSFYIYGHKCAIRLADTDESRKIMVIDSPELVDTYRRQFYSMWDIAASMSVPGNVTKLVKTVKG